MKSLVHLTELLLKDLGERCGVDVSRDVRTLRARVTHEGESFLTITLATYAQSLDQALDAGGVVPGSWGNFGRLRSGLPAFGSGFLHHVFDRRTGRLLRDARVDCVRALRQLSRFCTKVRIPCARAREAAALVSYEELDKTLEECQDPRACREDMPEGKPERPAVLWDTYQRVASIIIGAMTLEDEDGNVPVLCRHGPGATVEGYTPNGKWTLGKWHDRLEAAGLTHRLAHFGAEKPLRSLENVPVVPLYVRPEDEAPVRVVLVPKTLKSPRVIAVEPACMQFAQQGLAAVLRAGIDQCPYTAGQVHFRDQTVNQDLALLGSKTGETSTIDLKDASDRVTTDLVDVLFGRAPERFRRMLWAARSTRAQLPDGRVIGLKKFASMGSALCFPVESLVFFTLVVSARIVTRGDYPSPDTVARLSRGVYVYGDDIVAPADETPAICDSLEVFGLRVNRQKSFWTGQFRESCGVDAFRGEDVTPTYLRSTCPANRADSSEIVSWVATANALFDKGLFRAAGTLRERVEVLLGPLPQVPANSPAIGWRSFSNYTPRRRWNRRLQRREQLQWVATPVVRPDPLECGHGLLAKCLRRVKGDPFSQPEWTSAGRLRAFHREFLRAVPEIPEPLDGHIDESVRPHALTLKREWVPL